MNFMLVFALCFCCTLTTATITESICSKRRTCSTENYYQSHPQCKPSNWNKGKQVTCEALGASVPTGGGLYTNWELHYNVMLSPYYAARMADALGYDRFCPGRNRTLLKGMNLMTPFSGIHGTIAIDTSYGYDRNILRRCTFPTATHPFICRGSAGTPGTQGYELGTIGYVSLLHDDVNHRWTLFGQCWNAKTPENPNAVPVATSFNVFSLDSTLPPDDRLAIIAKLVELGFDTSNIIEPDFAGNPAAPKKLVPGDR